MKDNLKKSSRQPKKLIFGMPPYFDQLDEIWKVTSIFLKMEDDLIFPIMEDDLNFVLVNLIFGIQHCFNPTR